MRNFLYFFLLVIFSPILVAQNLEPHSKKHLIVKFKAEMVEDFKGSISNSKFHHRELDLLTKTSKTKSIKLTGNRTLADTYVLTFEEDQNIQSLISQFLATDLFEYVKPNFIGMGSGVKGLSSTIPNDFKFSKQWGAGVVYEKTDDAHHGAGVDVALAALYLHPWKELRLGVGFGQEKVGSYAEDDGHGHLHHHASHKEDVIRTSVSYDFHVGDFGIAPTLAFDFVGSQTATIFGVAIVRAF